MDGLQVKDMHAIKIKQNLLLIAIFLTIKLQDKSPNSKHIKVLKDGTINSQDQANINYKV